MKYEPELWRTTWQQEGWVAVPDVLNETTLMALRTAMERITRDLANVPPPLRDKLFLEREHVRNNPQWYAGKLTPDECGDAVRQIAELERFDPVFAQLPSYEPLREVLEVLFNGTAFRCVSLFGRPQAARAGNGVCNGNYQRDAAFAESGDANTLTALLCLDKLTAESGLRRFIRSSHHLTDDDARQPRWRNVSASEFAVEEQVAVACSAGAVIFWGAKTLHATGHNRSAQPLRTILLCWVASAQIDNQAE